MGQRPVWVSNPLRSNTRKFYPVKNDSKDSMALEFYDMVVKLTKVSLDMHLDW